MWMELTSYTSGYCSDSFPLYCTIAFKWGRSLRTCNNQTNNSSIMHRVASGNNGNQLLETQLYTIPCLMPAVYTCRNLSSCFWSSTTAMLAWQSSAIYWHTSALLVVYTPQESPLKEKVVKKDVWGQSQLYSICIESVYYCCQLFKFLTVLTTKIS